jgi:cell division protein ZapA
MRQINVTVNDRDYTIACEAGQEEHLAKLASYMDERVRELASGIGQVGHARLLLIAGLLVSDELSDAYGEIEQLKARIAELEGGAGQAAKAGEEAARAASERGTSALDSAAERIDAIAARLEAS